MNLYPSGISFCLCLDLQDLAGAQKAAEAEAKAIEEVSSCI
jgi:hypothetical protein